MSRRMKIWLITAAALLFFGLALCLLAVSLAGPELDRLNTESYTEKSLTIDEPFDSLTVRASSHQVRLLPSEDGTCRVEWSESERSRVQVAVKDGTLKAVEKSTGGAFGPVGFFWGPSAQLSVTLRLPEAEYRALTVGTSSGDVEVPEGFTFRTIRLDSTSGSLRFSAQAAEDLHMRSTSGDLELTGASPARAELESTSGSILLRSCVCGALSASATSGEISLENCRGGSLTLSNTSGGLELDNCQFSGAASLGTVSGDIRFSDLDAGSLSFDAVSGSVDGTLLSGKVFQTDTVSGRVSLPLADPSGGLCTAETTSGDIDIRLSER